MLLCIHVVSHSNPKDLSYFSAVKGSGSSVDSFRTESTHFTLSVWWSDFDHSAGIAYFLWRGHSDLD